MTIEKELFERLQQQYSSIISNIIKSNVRFYRTNQTIKWRFGYDERVAIFAWCDRKTNIVTVNIAAVDFSIQQNEPLNIEYFLLHEIRHIYQHLEIEDYRKDAREKGFTIGSAGYIYKTKKAKGEIIGELFLTKISLVYGELWE